MASGRRKPAVRRLLAAACIHQQQEQGGPDKRYDDRAKAPQTVPVEGEHGAWLRSKNGAAHDTARGAVIYV